MMEGKPLIGKKVIMDYLPGIGKDLFREFVRLGLPCWKSRPGAKLLSHTDAIDQWLIKMSFTQYGILNENDIDEEN